MSVETTPIIKNTQVDNKTINLDSQNQLQQIPFLIGNTLFKIFDEVGTFTNGNGFYCEKFGVSGGDNSMLDAGNTDLIFSTDLYQLPTGTDVAPSDTTYNPETFLNPDNAFDSDDGTASTLTITSGSKLIGKTFSEKFVGFVRAVTQYSGGTGTGAVKLHTYNGTTWDLHSTITNNVATKTTTIINLSSNVQGIAIEFRDKLNGNASLFSLEYGEYAASGNMTFNNISSCPYRYVSVMPFGDNLTNSTIKISDDNGSNYDIIDKGVGTIIDTSTLSGDAKKFQIVANKVGNLIPSIKGASIVGFN